MEPNNEDTELLLELEKHTGFKYKFIIFDERKWGTIQSRVDKGTFYQIVPETNDDGFFDWYNYTHMWQQRFRDKGDCLYVFYYNYKWWCEEGKPSFGEKFKKTHND